jgi:hypothetical protein
MMHIDISMTTDEKKFYSHSWWAKCPDFVIETLRAQLDAAAVIWPELKQFELVEHAGKARGGSRGGYARAEALSPERRQEIAKAAADARWSQAK